MSAQKRRPQQQPQQQQQYYPQQKYAQDPSGYTQYAGASWQGAQHLQQQQYYQPQQYPSSIDPYAFANNTQSSPYPQQHSQYQANPYYPQSQQYASPNVLGYQNTAYPQGGYLAADFGAASGDLSPNHLSPGSLSSGHSPKPSAGRSRLNNFTFPPQGTSPSLESQIAHLSIGAALPNKPTSAASSSPFPGSASGSRPASGMAHSAQMRPLASSTQATSAGDARFDLSLRYPPLPAVPARPATPPSIQARPASQADGSDASRTGVDQSVLDYISTLQNIITTYQQRDDLFRLRTEAVGFNPKQAYLAWQSPQNPSTISSPAEDPTPANPVLGVRLLQRLDKLQRENDELGRLLSSGTNVNSTSSATAEVSELRKEVQDCHELIAAMDKALGNAEARAGAAERALEVACRNNSTAIVPDGKSGGETGIGSEDQKKLPNTPKNASQGRRGSKAASNAANGGAKSGTPQQRNRSNNPNKSDSKPASTSNTVKPTRGGDSSRPAPADTNAPPTNRGKTR